MTAATISLCDIKAARIVLIDEAIMTRAAITVDRAAGREPAAVLAAGDPRLVRLRHLLEGVRLDADAQPSIDVRTLVHLDCTDGTARTIAATRGYDGRRYLSIDGKMMSTLTPLRDGLETLVKFGA